MKKENAKRLKEMLEATLVETEKMFKNEEVSKSYIIGYLEGAVKQAIIELKGQKWREEVILNAKPPNNKYWRLRIGDYNIYQHKRHIGER